MINPNDDGYAPANPNIRHHNNAQTQAPAAQPAPQQQVPQGTARRLIFTAPETDTGTASQHEVSTQDSRPASPTL
jgi:hypothetical protein